jgi:hypothetical protein
MLVARSHRKLSEIAFERASQRWLELGSTAEAAPYIAEAAPYIIVAIVARLV